MPIFEPDDVAAPGIVEVVGAIAREAEPARRELRVLRQLADRLELADVEHRAEYRVRRLRASVLELIGERHRRSRPGLPRHRGDATDRGAAEVRVELRVALTEQRECGRETQPEEQRLPHSGARIVVDRVAEHVVPHLRGTQRFHAIERIPDADLRQAPVHLQAARVPDEVAIDESPLRAKTVERRPPGSHAHGVHRRLAQEHAHRQERVARRLQTVGSEADLDVRVRLELIEVALASKEILLAEDLADAERDESAHFLFGNLLALPFSRLDLDVDARDAHDAAGQELQIHRRPIAQLIHLVATQHLGAGEALVAQPVDDGRDPTLQLLAVEPPPAHLLELPRQARAVAHGVETGHAHRVDEDRRPFGDVEPDVDTPRLLDGNGRVDGRLVEASLPVEQPQAKDVALELYTIETPLRAEEETDPPPEAGGRGGDGRLELRLRERPVAAEIDVVDADVARITLEILRTTGAGEREEERARE